MGRSSSRVRQVFDSVEEPLRKQAEALAATEEYSRALLGAFGAWTTVSRGMRSVSSGLLHLANLPAHQDVRRLTRQLGALEGKVDRIAAELERISERLERTNRRGGKGARSEPSGG